ncbi:MAG: DEAD/DEAH box helicase family protein [Acidimicrobiales bacterium]|nr:DEAD/DEAH box helicase family protein [Acidimicrobiales bacterium]
MIVPFDPVAVEDVAARLDLRDPNRRAVMAVADTLDSAEPGAEIVCDLATATGKTYIAAGVIDYLAAAGTRNVLIVCPGTTILTKTVTNFTPGSAKFVAGLEVRPTVITAEDFARGSVSESLRSSEDFKLFVFNVQQLLRPTANTSRRVRDYDENLGASLYEHLRSVPDLVVIADEHHSYFGPQFSRAVRDLSPQALIGLTATPDPRTDPDHIVFHYPLAEAIADGYVKVPVLVARRDGSADIRRQLADGVILLKHKAAALAAYADQTGEPSVNPVMFLVCSTIEEANEVAEILAGPDLLGDPAQVLTVTSDSPDAALDALGRVEEPDSPVRAIVSVQMLKEGWDVKNIYVVCALRALESESLSEQVLGRGLRLPFGQRTGRQMLDTVEVLSHRRFRDLLTDAGTLLEAFFTERHPTQLVAPDDGSLAGAGETAVLEAADGSGRLDVLVGSTGVFGETGEVVDGGLFGAAVEDIERRLAETEQQALALTTTMDIVAGASRVKFPRLVPRLVPQPFSLSTVPNQAAADLGAQFASDTAPTLDRQALGADRIADETGEGVQIAATVAEDPVEASQLSLPVDALRDRIRSQVLRSRYVTSTRQESNAITRLVAAFLTGAGVTDEESTTWTDAKVANAVSSFLSLVRQFHSQRGTSLQTGVELVDHPPTGIVAPDEVFPRTAAWAPRRWYSGWTRSILPYARFDARSTELALAELFEASNPDVAWWLRVETHQDVWIPYGHRQRHYPDFIVVAGDRDHWMVEGKADDRANDPDVLEKKNAGFEWARFANDSGDATATWHYLFATETAIKQAGGTWSGLKNFAEWE